MLQCFSLVTDEKYQDYFPTATDDFAQGLLEEEIYPPISLPPEQELSSSEYVQLDKYRPEIRPYISDIFIDKYSSVIGKHCLDSGQLRYLGKIVIRTKPGMKLPKHHRLYNVSERELKHLCDIMDFLKIHNIIRETFQDSEESSSSPWGACAFLVPRKSKEGENEGMGHNFARLVIDFRTGGLNGIILPTPSLVASIESSLEKLRGSYLFSCMDLKQSYFGMTLDEKSQSLTQFLVPPGKSFCFKRVPMGISSAPSSLLEKLNQVFNYVPKRDAQGQIVYQEGEDPKDPTAKAVLLFRPLRHVLTFYDDILVFTKKVSEKMEENLRYHFEQVKLVVERMALYDLRTTFTKCEFALREILFLGWIVKDDTLKPDPKRMEKIKNFSFPQTRKDMQGFLGLLNTVKRLTPLQVGELLPPLTELTSIKTKYEPTDIHRQNFEKIKELLTSQELSCSLINPHAEKLLFTDASGTAYGSVLLERMGEQNVPLLKSHILTTDQDPLNVAIREWDLPYFQLEATESTIQDSFYHSLIKYSREHNLHKIPDSVFCLKKQIVEFIKKDMIGQQLKEKVFKGNTDQYHQYLFSEILNSKVCIDPQSVVLEAVSKMINRGILVVIDQADACSKPIREISGHVSQTVEPIILGFYQQTQRFVPLKSTLGFEFDSDLLNYKYKIVYYDSKIIPQCHRNRSILEHEATALLLALKKYQHYIKGVTTHVIIDNRSLFYLFSPAINHSHAKISRFHLKLVTDFPTVKIMWCRSAKNIADLFTRFNLSSEYENKIKFQHFQIDSVPEIPNYTSLDWLSWDQITKAHDKCLKILVDLSKTYKTTNRKKLEKLESTYMGKDDCRVTTDNTNKNCSVTEARNVSTAHLCPYNYRPESMTEIGSPTPSRGRKEGKRR